MSEQKKLDRPDKIKRGGLFTRKPYKSLKSDRPELREKINKTEALLDGLNVKYCTVDRLCLFCGAKDYDGKEGIIHNEKCVIRLLRKLPSLIESQIEEAKKQERERIFKEIGRHTYKIRCQPFQATKIRFIRIPEPNWQALKEEK